MMTNLIKKSKKKIIFVFFISICSYLCHAQMLSSRHGKLETIKMSYIIKKLNLSDKEARQFWVIYPQYLKDLSAAKHNNVSSKVKCEEELLNIRKKYKNEMMPILGDSLRVNRVFILEKNYREMLRRELKKRAILDSIN